MFPIRDSVPRRHTPTVVYSLIVINAVIFLLQTSMTPSEAVNFIYNFGLVPYFYFLPDGTIREGATVLDLWPFVTATFLHGGWLHVIFNMWTLYIFGSTLEDRIGSPQFLIFYLCCGALSTYAHGYFNATSQVPVIGASGAIAGVIGAYALRFPTAQLTILLPIIVVPFIFTMPALAYGAIWFAFQLFQGTWDALTPSLGSGVAWWAHIGGFVAGLALLPLFLLFAPSRPAPPPPWQGPWG